MGKTAKKEHKSYSITCVVCGSQFVSARSHARMCSDACRWKASRWKAEGKEVKPLGPLTPLAMTISVEQALQMIGALNISFDNMPLSVEDAKANRAMHNVLKKIVGG